MNRIELLQSKRKGSAVALVLIAVVVLFVVGVGMLSIGQHTRILAVRTASEIAARCAADAGLAKVVFKINEKLKATTGEVSAPLSQEMGELSLSRQMAEPIALLEAVTDEVLPNCDATFEYKTAATSADSTFANEFLTISCSGKSGQAVRTVYATLRLKGVFDSAIHVADRISLMPNTLVTGYNSADPDDTDIDLKIGTTSILADRIPLGPGTVVEGDVFVGVGGDPEVVIGAGGTITGKKYALAFESELPVISPPALPDKGAELRGTGETLTILPTHNGKYTGISLTQAGGSPGILEISGGNVVLHVTGNIDLGTGCEIVVRPQASLTLYIDGDISAGNSAGFNNESGNVADFKLFATGQGEQVFELKAKSSVFGAIYAPNVDIDMYPSSELHGAITARSVSMKSGGVFYYDEALRNVSIYDEGVRYVLHRWYEQ